MDLSIHKFKVGTTSLFFLVAAKSTDTNSAKLVKLQFILRNDFPEKQQDLNSLLRHNQCLQLKLEFAEIQIYFD